MTDQAVEEEVVAEAPDQGETEQTVKAANVIEALARVQEEIGGIRKMTQAQRRAAGQPVEEGSGVKWAYRGIDQITQAAQPLFGKHGVVIVPELKHHVVDEIVVNDKPWTDTTVIVKWTVYGPGGVGDKITSRTIGIGRDNSDKGYNKAMTGAYKNLLLRILTIGDPQDDTDQQSHPNGEVRFLTDEQAQEIVDFVVSLPEPHKAAAKAHIAEKWTDTKHVPATAWDTGVTEMFDKFKALAAQDAAEQPAAPVTETVDEEPLSVPESDETTGEGPVTPDGPVQGPVAADGQVVCADCGEVGHTSIDCPNVPEEDTLLDGDDPLDDGRDDLGYG